MKKFATLRELLQKANEIANASPTRKDALILEAFIDGYFEIVNYLIENGAAMEHFTVSLVFFPLKENVIFARIKYFSRS